MTIKLPQQYEWLLQEQGPKMLTEALKLYGTKEIVGRQHNPIILSWAKELGMAKMYTNDETAWCGLAHAIIAKRAGKIVPFKDYDFLRALKWASFGIEVQDKKPNLGDTLVFKREGGGHVGLYVGEDAEAYHVLGGNQSNAYNITRISKNRLFAARRPAYDVLPSNVRVVKLAKAGMLSKNEA